MNRQETYSVALFLLWAAAVPVLSGEAALVLRPPRACTGDAQGSPMAFYQAIPFETGALPASQSGWTLFAAGERIPAAIDTAAFWPDGSVQWLSIDGVWPARVPVAETMQATLTRAAKEIDAAPMQWMAVRGTGHTIEIARADGKVIAALRPEVKALHIAEPKPEVSQAEEDQDTKVQYAWAEPLSVLNPKESPFPLTMRLNDFAATRKTPAFTVYRARGDGRSANLEGRLEWQLRIRVYRQTRMVRLQMTWLVHWDPTKFALASAKWIVGLRKPISVAHGLAAGEGLALSQGDVELTSTAPGRSRVMHGTREIVKSEWPEPRLHTWTLGTPNESSVSLALPNFTRLGPNRLVLRKTGLDIAAWDEGSGLALDLRRIVKRDEFGMDEADFGADAKGMARTIDMTLAWADSSEAAAAAASREARRDWLWLASRDDLIRTQAIAPWQAGAYERNLTYLTCEQAKIHFVLSSGDHWRWNGFVNYGDVRTNWHRRGWPKGRLHALKWGMHGRYGWRNGSAEPYRGFLTLGLFMNDRAMVLGAFDYALHVVDVDVCHGPFGQALKGDQGGMHRRNKQHWSGDVQMQYTTSRGLYLMSWLTGHERLADTLAEIRDYARRHAGSSIFAAAAWLNRYSETHDAKDLAAAEQLLSAAVRSWDGREKPAGLDHLKGMDALYAGNFRAKLDCWPALIEFHRATRDDAYSNAILASVKAHPMLKPGIGDLARYYGIAYLLALGVAESEIGTDKTARFRKALRDRKYGETIPRAKWNYQSLVRTYRATYTTAELGWRASFVPLVLRYFDSGDVK